MPRPPFHYHQAMSPEDYLEEIVLPTILDYERDTSSRRLAYLACIVVVHLADYLEKAGVMRPQVTIRESCLAAWQVVHAVAIGAKHVDNDANPNPVKFRAGSDFYRPPAVAGQFECGASMLGDVEGSIVIFAEGPYGPGVLFALRTVMRQYQIQFGEFFQGNGVGSR